MAQRYECLDGNEAAARVAYALSEVISIYPITPASAMAEHCDDWSAAGRPNLWGAVPDVIEMQSEAGAAGALHGALQKGALGDDVHRVAGPAADDPQHVQDRRRADADGHPRRGPHDRDPRPVDLRRPQRRDARPGHRLGDARRRARSRRRTTSRSSPTPRRCAARVPFLHFFDGFRTSPRDQQDRASSSRRRPAGARPRRGRRSPSARRGMTPGAPVVRGTAQNPDVFFQAREASNPYHLAVPGIVAGGHGRARRADRPALRPGRLPRRPGRRARRSSSWARPAARSRRPSTRSSPPASGSGCSGSACSSRSRPSSSSPRCRRPSARSPSSTGPRSRAPSASRSTSRRSRRSTEAMDGDDAAVRGRAAGHRRPLRPVVQGDDALDDQADLRRARAPRGRSATSRSASTTTSPT